ncbi:MAG: TetR/AcrR family transcriptional regulator [Actinobacteria bacterium]|nr:TetR/AcrR family transcriptional regulator [Actinomycetota bacterium]
MDQHERRSVPRDVADDPGAVGGPGGVGAVEAGQRRSDGQQTHEAILDTAMRLASIEGIEGLSFGRLARELGITKSGVFAHFRDEQHLQRETIRAALDVFEREVVSRGVAAPPGRARLEALCEAYLSYIEREVLPGGCFLAQPLADYDARRGPIHDELADGQRGWLRLLTDQATTAPDRAELDAAIDPAQLAFELYAHRTRQLPLRAVP